MKRLIWWGVIGASVALAEPLPSFAKNKLLSAFQISGEGGPAPMLLDISKGQGNLSKAEGNYLPNRVYGIFHKGAKAWVYTLTTFHGRLPKPLELLYRGTVVPGSYIGATNPLQRYKLSPTYLWVPTDDRETHFMVVPERPGEIKHVIYRVPPIHRDAFDDTLKK